MQCPCGNWYHQPDYKLNPQLSIELCYECVRASTPQTYVNKEWVHGCITENTEYNPQQNDN